MQREIKITTDNPPLTLADLDNFHGSEHWYRHALNKQVTFTDGAKFLADRAGAYWLLDEIALAQWINRVKAEEFQVWKFVVTGSMGDLTCEDGNGNEVVAKKIDFTDFPLPKVTLWFENNVIYLPSEH